MIKVYLDCNILIDWLLDREPYSHFASGIIQLTEQNEIQSYVSPLILANTYYIISKTLNKKVADEFIKDSLILFKFVDMTEDIIRSAVNNKYKDFEDDLHYHTAIAFSVDYLITRNKKDFRSEKIEVVDAEEFINLIEGLKNTQ